MWRDDRPGTERRRELDRQAGHGRRRPFLGPVEELVEGYRRWATGELDPDGALDSRGVPATFPLSEPGADFELAEHFGWSWQQLQATPLLVRRLWLRLLMVRRKIEADRADSQQASSPPTESDRRNAQAEIAAAQAAEAAREAGHG